MFNNRYNIFTNQKKRVDGNVLIIIAIYTRINLNEPVLYIIKEEARLRE